MEVMGNVALATKVFINSGESQRTVDDRQVSYICSMFKKAVSSSDTKTGIEPLLIKRHNVRLSTGFGDLVEIHGYFTKDVVETAVFQLKDSGELNGWSEDSLIDYAEEKGIVEVVRFMRPCIRLRYH